MKQVYEIVVTKALFKIIVASELFILIFRISFIKRLKYWMACIEFIISGPS